MPRGCGARAASRGASPTDCSRQRRESPFRKRGREGVAPRHAPAVAVRGAEVGEGAQSAADEDLRRRRADRAVVAHDRNGGIGQSRRNRPEEKRGLDVARAQKIAVRPLELFVVRHDDVRRRAGRAVEAVVARVVPEQHGLRAAMRHDLTHHAVLDVARGLLPHVHADRNRPVISRRHSCFFEINATNPSIGDESRQLSS